MTWKNLRKENIKASWEVTQDHMEWLKRTLTFDTPKHIIQLASPSSQSWAGSTKCLFSWAFTQDNVDDLDAASICIQKIAGQYVMSIHK